MRLRKTATTLDLKPKTFPSPHATVHHLIFTWTTNLLSLGSLVAHQQSSICLRRLWVVLPLELEWKGPQRGVYLDDCPSSVPRLSWTLWLEGPAGVFGWAYRSIPNPWLSGVTLPVRVSFFLASPWRRKLPREPLKRFMICPSLPH